MSKDRDRPQGKKALTQDQSVLALSLLTDVINGRRAAITFTIDNGQLVEISTSKVLEPQKTTRGIREYLKS